MHLNCFVMPLKTVSLKYEVFPCYPYLYITKMYSVRENIHCQGGSDLVVAASNTEKGAMQTRPSGNHHSSTPSLYRVRRSRTKVEKSKNAVILLFHPFY